MLRGLIPRNVIIVDLKDFSEIKNKVLIVAKVQFVIELVNTKNPHLLTSTSLSLEQIKTNFHNYYKDLIVI